MNSFHKYDFLWAPFLSSSLWTRYTVGKGTASEVNYVCPYFMDIILNSD